MALVLGCLVMIAITSDANSALEFEDFRFGFFFVCFAEVVQDDSTWRKKIVCGLNDTVPGDYLIDKDKMF